MKKLEILLCMWLAGCATSIDTETQASKSGPGPLAAFAGRWQCAVTYFDSPPLSFAHEQTAGFEVVTDGNSIVGVYQETGPVAPIALSDQLTLDAPSAGSRIYSGTAGDVGFEQVGTFDLFTPAPDGGEMYVSFTGTYSVIGFGISVPFSEQLTLAADGQSFDLVAQLAGQTFVEQECTGVQGQTAARLASSPPETSICELDEDGNWQGDCGDPGPIGGGGSSCNLDCDPTSGWVADLLCSSWCGGVSKCFHTYRCGNDWSCPEAHIGYCG